MAIKTEIETTRSAVVDGYLETRILRAEMIRVEKVEPEVAEAIVMQPVIADESMAAPKGSGVTDTNMTVGVHMRKDQGAGKGKVIIGAPQNLVSLLPISSFATHPNLLVA